MLATTDISLLCTPADIILDCSLTVAIFISFLPQALRILRRESSDGISPLYVLAHGIFSCCHVSLVILYYATAYTTSSGELVLAQISSGKLHGAAAVGALMGLVQAAVQAWNAIWIILLAIQYMPTNGPPPQPTRHQLRTIVLVSCAATITWGLSTLNALGPRGNILRLTSDAASAMLFSSMALGCAGLGVVQLMPQHSLMRATGGDPGALSLTSLCSQALVACALGLRWMQRVEAGTRTGGTSWPMAGGTGVLESLQAVSTWNYFIEAVGLALIVFAYQWQVHRHGHHRIGCVVPRKGDA